MFGKINRSSIISQINNTKNFLGKKYTEGKRFLNNVDDGVRIAKRVYSVLAPTIETFAGNTNFNKLNKTIMNSVNTYDNMRSQVLDSHEQVHNNINNVVSGLKKAKVNIGL